MLYGEFNGRCVMQFVRLATTRVTSPAALHASLVRRLCMKLDWPPRKSLDWMMAATRVHWLKSRVRVVWLIRKYFSNLLVIWYTMTSLATVRVIGLVLLASPLVLVYFAAWIVCLRSASLNWMSRASPCHLAVVPASAVVRMSPDC